MTIEHVFKCDECGWVGNESSILVRHVDKPHPKTREYEQINQCPECGLVECFTNVCDELGCTHVAGCGWPSPDGYRRTCGKHAKL